MNRQKEMIQELLRGLAIIEQIKETSSFVGVFGHSERRESLVAWAGRVSSTFEAADMTEELRIWNEALRSRGLLFSPQDPSMMTQIATLKAVLVGFLEKYDRGGPSDELFPMELVEGTRDYIESIAEQASGCYERGWYDACAVMLRRLIETLIIECFECHGIGARIQDEGGNYFYLADLISAFLKETTWHKPCSMDRYLQQLKSVGDRSAHDRYFTAKRSDIEKLSEAIRSTIQSLVYIAKLQ